MPYKHLLLAISTAAFMAGCASTSPEPAPFTVADTLATDPSLSTVNSLVIKSGLNETLKGAGPFTMFAPTNDAFKALPAKTLDALGKDPAMLKSVLAYHVVPGRMLASEVRNGKVKTINGSDLALARAGDYVTAEDALVRTANLGAVNGVVHAVDRVLIPPKKK